MAHLDHTPEIPEQPDEWHLHSAAEGPAQEEHGSTVNTMLLAFAFIGTVLSIGLVVVLTYMYFSAYMNQLRRTRIETTTLAADYLQYRADSDRALHDYVWLDEDRTIVSLPIGVAMERVLENYAREQRETEGQQR
jgi:hypothetical protein